MRAHAHLVLPGWSTCLVGSVAVAMLQMALYTKGIDTWAASTVDARDVWHASMRHIVTEGRCFVVSACQSQPPASELNWKAPEDWPDDDALIDGGSVICDPYGAVLADPLRGEECLVSAEIDLSVIMEARYDLDVVGHYARPDVFQLSLDKTPSLIYPSSVIPSEMKVRSWVIS